MVLAQNFSEVLFLYGLTFFSLGLTLSMACRQIAAFKFARAIRPLAVFGILYSLVVWIDMFQIIAMPSGSKSESGVAEVVQLLLLITALIMLLVFGLTLLSPEHANRAQQATIGGAMVGVWAVAVVGVALASSIDLLDTAAVLAQYLLGIPGALLGTWALMVQQRAFRMHNMSRFGRDLVWAAVALFLFGVVGGLFAANPALFTRWFGLPVQLFQAAMVVVFNIYLVRAMRVFLLEAERRLEQANQAKLEAQANSLAAERRISHEMERLNDELRQTAHELTLILDLSNLLAQPRGLRDRLQGVLGKIVSSIGYAEAGMIILIPRDGDESTATVSIGYADTGANAKPTSRYALCVDLGEHCMARSRAMCRHLDGAVVEFSMENALATQECRHHPSPTLMIGMPLFAENRVIGCIVLAGSKTGERRLSADEFALMVGICQQLGLSIDNARLYRDVRRREKTLADLLHQVVGAQETERKRIARELHDATGQSLTAISLGLRGVETMVSRGKPVSAAQIRELQTFGTSALGELRQIISDLRPSQLDDLGLVAALHWYVQSFESRCGVKTEFVLKGRPERLASEYETVLFRMVQEAFTNIAKHAKATMATVALQIVPNQVTLEITDNGAGFDPKIVLNGDNYPSAWGLLGIQERTSLLGGVCHINSVPGEGTKIVVQVPLMTEITYGEKDTAVAG